MNLDLFDNDKLKDMVEIELDEDVIVEDEDEGLMTFVMILTCCNFSWQRWDD